ncbi:hypothetical protein BGY98DRAFT_88012 [Russula aff. rugulosa BPL654]|nr:hypothetical protein BGY98DRAFT_88012 [Russula aff. rugulosa BPL654]
MHSAFDDIDHQLSLSHDPRHTRSLKSYRNSLTPVSRLPHILLTDIFILIHQSERTDNLFLHRSPPCLQISHVSGHGAIPPSSALSYGQTFSSIHLNGPQ